MQISLSNKKLSLVRDLFLLHTPFLSSLRQLRAEVKSFLWVGLVWIASCSACQSGIFWCGPFCYPSPLRLKGSNKILSIILHAFRTFYCCVFVFHSDGLRCWSLFPVPRVLLTFILKTGRISVLRNSIQIICIVFFLSPIFFSPLFSIIWLWKSYCLGRDTDIFGLVYLNIWSHIFQIFPLLTRFS